MKKNFVKIFEIIVMSKLWSYGLHKRAVRGDILGGLKGLAIKRGIRKWGARKWAARTTMF